MKQEISQERNNFDSFAGSNFSYSCCPKCGATMISTSQQVTAEYPSPPLERLVCSSMGCNYVKYVKLNEFGFAEESVPMAEGEV